MPVALAIVVPPMLVWFDASLVRARLYRDVIRSHQGLCGSCGYDVRKTPGRCPECGAVPRWTP